MIWDPKNTNIIVKRWVRRVSSDADADTYEEISRVFSRYLYVNMKVWNMRIASGNENRKRPILCKKKIIWDEMRTSRCHWHKCRNAMLAEEEIQHKPVCYKLKAVAMLLLCFGFLDAALKCLKHSSSSITYHVEISHVNLPYLALRGVLCC